MQENNKNEVIKNLIVKEYNYTVKCSKNKH